MADLDIAEDLCAGSDHDATADLLNDGGVDVVNAHERDPLVVVEGMRQAAELAAAGRLDVSALVTHVYPLAALGEAFQAAMERPPGFVKAVVCP